MNSYDSSPILLRPNRPTFHGSLHPAAFVDDAEELVAYKRQSLDDDWIVYFNSKFCALEYDKNVLHFNKHDKKTHFILLHRTLGLLFLEVKYYTRVSCDVCRGGYLRHDGIAARRMKTQPDDAAGRPGPP